ncbi:MAG: DUF445 family protein [Myxococcota bacterium]|nr:DUF445 family protein [Myxococcota bacterium]
MDPLLLSIPFVTAIIGWGTNLLAIHMLFHPVNRVGGARLGWQGVLPSQAKRMAQMCVEMMTTQLIDARQVFERIDPDRVSELLSPFLEEHAERIIEETLQAQHPKLWQRMPEALRERARKRIQKQIPEIVEQVLGEVGEDLENYLDLEGLVVEAFTKNRQLVNDLFWECGSAEFQFIARSGFFFGGLFGCVQAVVWSFVQPTWFLPATGLLVGWATNWLALKMVFEPRYPKGFGPLSWHGLFHRRQPEVSQAYARFFSERILTSENLINAVLTGPAAEKLVEQIRVYTEEAVDQAAGLAKPLLRMTVGGKEWSSLKEQIGFQLLAVLPGAIIETQAYADEAMDLHDNLATSLEALPPEQFEGVLRPIFQEDETTLIAVGAALGFVAGILQLLIVTTL